MNLLKNKNLKTLCISVFLVLGATPDTGLAEPAKAPESIVEDFHSALLNAASMPHFEDRVQQLAPVVERAFRSETIGRISLGSHWRTLDSTTRSDFATLLNELITTTYASRFNQFNNQSFVTLIVEPISADRRRVKTRLTTASETVQLDYQMQSIDDEWRIYDVVANGVSDLSLKRSTYSALLPQGGLEAVINEIRKSIAGNRQTAAN